MQNKFIDKLLNCERHAGVVSVLLLLLCLFVPFAALLFVAFVGAITVLRSSKFTAIVLLYSLIPAVALLFLHDGLGARAFILFGMGGVTAAIFWSLRHIKCASEHSILFSLTGLACLLAMAVTAFVPSLSAHWHSEVTQQIASLGMKVPTQVLDQLSDPRVFAVAFGENIAIGLVAVLLGSAIGLVWVAKRYAKPELLSELTTIRISPLYALLVLLYVVALCLFKSIPLWAGLPVLFLPWFIAGLSLLHSLGWMRRVWRALVWFWFVALMLALLVNPTLLIAAIGVLFLIVCALVVFGFLGTWVNFRCKRSEKKDP